MTVLGIIPARYASTRFPGKPLAELAGRPLIQHVYERARQARGLTEVLVATDDERIQAAVEAFGGRVVMTASTHPTGTDRLAEVARLRPDADVIINIQGDEPLIEPSAIEAVTVPLLADAGIPMSSAMCPLPDPIQARNPNIVKVVCDLHGFALYFSRAPIPFPRDGELPLPWMRHLGLYGYRREFLLAFAALRPTPLESLEKLEQLRVLEHGHRIKMVALPADPAIGVDTPEDLEQVRLLLESRLGARGDG
jgi:3-deoxy-manno-octulosonate cytidylyltransferase (CMP-KDO synthetase)